MLQYKGNKALMQHGWVRNAKPIFSTLVLLRLAQAVGERAGRLRRCDHHVDPCGIGLRVHKMYVCCVHGSGVSRRIIGRPCLLDGGRDPAAPRILGKVVSDLIMSVAVGVPRTRRRV